MSDDDDKIIEKDRFCIYCGIWFNDEKIVCPNCNQVKVPTAATRTRIIDSGLDKLLKKYKRKLGIDKDESK